MNPTDTSSTGSSHNRAIGPARRAVRTGKLKLHRLAIGTTALGLALTSAVALPTPAAADTLLVDTTLVSLSSSPNDVVVDTERGLVYVSIQAMDEIYEISLANGAVQDRHELAAPAGIELSADGKYLYVALNYSTGIARIDLSDWSSSQVVLPELGSNLTWDVIEIEPGVVLVSADPGSSDFAWIVRYDFNTNTAERVASERIIRHEPRFAMDGGNYVYVGEVHLPNSLYQLDLATPLLDIVREDDHGSADGTGTLAVSLDGTFVVTATGQKYDTSTLVQVGSYDFGLPLFSDDGSLLYSYHDPLEGPPVLSVDDAATTHLIEQWQPDCGTASTPYQYARFTKGVGSDVLLVTTPDALCMIHSDTARPVAPPPPPPPPAIPDGGRFFDDDANIHEGSIEALATAGITKGCNPPYQTGYCPHSPVTREQMAAFLVRALGLTDNGGGNSFVDDDSSIFEEDIARLAAAGITRGCNPPANTLFCPKAPVTRGQMAAFLVRALSYADDGNDLFVDDDGSVFETDINRLGTAGVTRGCNPPANDRYCPDDLVTRAQMATFLARALQLPVHTIPPRPDTIDGTDLAIISWAEMAGCSGESGEICNVGAGSIGATYLLTGWYAEDWSALPTAEKSEFKSNKVRLEAIFDGVPIDLVEWPFEVIDNTGLKSYSFQFPSWLDGDHTVEVYFIDEYADYLWTVRVNMDVLGDGYPALPSTRSATGTEPTAVVSGGWERSFIAR